MALAMASTTTLLSGAGCKTKETVILHLETRSGSILYWSEGIVTFNPQGDTWFRQYGEGSWADGAVTYGVNDSGEFEIRMDGEWMQEQALANMERFGGSFVVEIPLTNIEANGTFELTAEYRYNDVDDGTGWRTTHEGRLFGPLEFPYNPATGEKISLLMQCVDEQREACTPTSWDPDTVETPDEVVEDAPDADTDPDVVDTTEDTEPDTAPDTTEDTAPDTTEDTAPDTTEDTAPDTPDDTASPDTTEVVGDTAGDSGGDAPPG
jgi:hypothetical protein